MGASCSSAAAHDQLCAAALHGDAATVQKLLDAAGPPARKQALLEGEIIAVSVIL